MWGRGPPSFTCGYPVVTGPFVEKIIFPPLNCLDLLKSSEHACKGLYPDSECYFIYLYPCASTTLSLLV